METIQALIDALKEFKGGLIVVSHDQHFIQQVRQCANACLDRSILLQFVFWAATISRDDPRTAITANTIQPRFTKTGVPGHLRLRGREGQALRRLLRGLQARRARGPQEVIDLLAD
jgi:hypothetical protein